MKPLLLLVAGIVSALLIASAAPAQEALRYETADRGCSRPPKLLLSCAETGYTGGLERHAYSDLRSIRARFTASTKATSLRGVARRLPAAR